jgi:hypothetical protein
MSQTGNIPTRDAVILTHTTARISGAQSGRIDVAHARTAEASVTVVWGGIALRFLSAAAASTVLEGFAAVRPLLMHVDNTAPVQEPPTGTYAVPALALTWTWPTDYAVVHRNSYSQTWKRTLHWVDLHMGPVTWQIIDHTGYHSAIELLREAHRTAVAVCADGGTWRADPTNPDYTRPGVKPRTSKRAK